MNGTFCAISPETETEGLTLSAEMIEVETGQGADEIFSGYHWYPMLMRSNDPTEDYARVYFDRDHAEMGQALAPKLMNGDYSREFLEEFFRSSPSARSACSC